MRSYHNETALFDKLILMILFMIVMILIVMILMILIMMRILEVALALNLFYQDIWTLV